MGNYPIVAKDAVGSGLVNYNIVYVDGNMEVTTGFAFIGFLSPIGGADLTGGSFGDPLRTFKLGSTIPVKFKAVWLNGGTTVVTGSHKLVARKYSSNAVYDAEVIAIATDAATSGNEFRLSGGEWHFNLSTKGMTAGTWELTATLQDGSTHTVWIAIKK
jgi:hypothetical protein